MALVKGKVPVAPQSAPQSAPLVTTLTRAIRPVTDQGSDPTPDDLAAAAVIRDVWLAALVGWVTGRTTAADVSRSLDTAVRLLLR